MIYANESINEGDMTDMGDSPTKLKIIEPRFGGQITPANTEKYEEEETEEDKN